MFKQLVYRLKSPFFDDHCLWGDMLVTPFYPGLEILKITDPALFKSQKSIKYTNEVKKKTRTEEINEAFVSQFINAFISDSVKFTKEQSSLTKYS